MKRLLQIVDRLGEWIILTFVFLLTSILTLGFGVGVSYLSLVHVVWRPATDDQGYVLRNYQKHFKTYWKWPIILSWLGVVLILILNAFLIQFLLIQPPSLIASFLIVGQGVVMAYLLSLILYYPSYRIRQVHMTWERYVWLPLAQPGLTLLFIASTLMSLLMPIYVSFAFIFIIFPVVAEAHAWIGKRVRL